MSQPERSRLFPEPAARVCNGDASSPIVILCDHASNEIPPAFANLGLRAEQLNSHIAFDPNAAALTGSLAEALDAVYVLCGYSRLLIDVNRAPGDPDSIVTENDNVPIPGNRDITEKQRSERVNHIYAPYHATVDDMLAKRVETFGTQAVVSVHSFTSHMGGLERPWDIGIIFNRDRRLARALSGALVDAARDCRLTVGLNRPYSPEDRVYHTLQRHAEVRGLPCVMIEIPNDQLATGSGRQWWTDCLGAALKTAVPFLTGNGHAS